MRNQPQNYPIYGVVRNRTIVEDLVLRRHNGPRPVTIGASVIAQAVGGVVVEAAGLIKNVIVALLLDGLDWLDTLLRPIAQLVRRALVYRCRGLLVFWLFLPRVFLLRLFNYKFYFHFAQFELSTALVYLNKWFALVKTEPVRRRVVHRRLGSFVTPDRREGFHWLAASRIVVAQFVRCVVCDILKIISI